MKTLVRPLSAVSSFSIASLALLALAPSAAAQASPEMVTKIKQEGLENSMVMDYLDRMTNGIGHRLTGSDNFTQACNWAQAEFEKMGLKSWQESWDTWPVTWNRGQWQGRILEPMHLELQVATSAWTAGTKGREKARIVNAPKTLKDLEVLGDALAGAWVFGSMPRIRRSASEEKKAAHAKLLAAYEKADIRGWISSSRGDAKYPNRMRVFGRRPYSADNLPTTPQIVVRSDQAKQLRKLLKGDKPVIAEFDIRNRFINKPIVLNNVIAEITGSEFPDEVIILCGHLDSWHQATGTTDNGTGTTSTMEAARILASVGAKPKRTIRFCLWGGEEQGLLGSQGYVKRHRTEMKNIVAVFNHDTGTNWAQNLTVNAAAYDDMLIALAPLKTMTPPDPDFEDPVFRLAKKRRITKGMGSDHASFIAASACGFSWGLKGRSNYFGYTWHSQWDTYDVAIPEYQRHNATVFALAALGVAQLPNKISSEGMGPNPIAKVEEYLNVRLGGEGMLEVVKVDNPGRAQRAGFRQGDRINRISGKPVANFDEAIAELRNVGFGSATFTVKRGDEDIKLEPKGRRRSGR